MRTSGIMKLTPAVSGLPSTRVSSLMSGDTSGFMLSSFSCTDGAQVEIRPHRWHHTIRIAPLEAFYLISFHEPFPRHRATALASYSIDCTCVTCAQTRLFSDGEPHPPHRSLENTIHIAPGKTHSFVAGYAAWGMLHSVTAKPTSESGTIDWCATDID